MPLERFVQAHINNLQRGTQTSYFRQLIGGMDTLYLSAMRAMPPGRSTNHVRASATYLPQGLFVSLIAVRQPEDSVPITRRAIEAAKKGLAIKLNVANVENWLQGRERLER
jgi:hypothetical protein